MIAARQQAGQAWRRRNGRRRAHPRGCGACISTAGMARCISPPPIPRAAASMKHRRSFSCMAKMAAAPTSAAARRYSARTVRSMRRTCRAAAVPIPRRAAWRSPDSRSRSSDLFEQLRLRRVDLVGCGRGASVAYELANTRSKEVRRLIVAGTQQPATAIAQPMLQLSPDPGRVLQEPAESVAAEIRAFLDRV